MIYELGATIKELCKKQNMTQKELAQRLNVSKAFGVIVSERLFQISVMMMQIVA